MDRHVFRGKRTDNKEWVYGGLIQCEDSSSYGENRIWSNFHIVEFPEHLTTNAFSRGNAVWTYNEFIQVISETVGQCTAMRNEEGVLVFEGDIVRFAIFDYNGADTQHIGVIYWCDGAFWIDCTETEGDEGIYSLGQIIQQDPFLEVRGNIHDDRTPLNHAEGDAEKEC